MQTFKITIFLGGVPISQVENISWETVQEIAEECRGNGREYKIERLEGKTWKSSSV